MLIMGKVTPEKFISFTRSSLILAFCWPLPTNATKFQILRFKILRLLSILSSLLLLLPLLNTLYTHHKDIVLMSKTVCLLVPVLQVALQGSVLIHSYPHLQFVITEIEEFLQVAKPYERNVLQRYVDACAIFHVIFTCWFYLTALAFICGPLVLPQPFPTEAIYPFCVEYQPLKSIIFIHQSLIGLQAASQLSFVTLAALLLWLVSARLELLSMEFQIWTNVYEFIACVRKHEKLLRDAQELIAAVRFPTLVTIVLSTIVLSFSGLTLVKHPPLLVKVQSVTVIFSGALEVFICAWPADHLISMVFL